MESSSIRRDYWRNRVKEADWSLDFRRDGVIAVLASLAALVVAHGKDAWENAWIPLLSAIIAITIYESCRFVWRFVVTVPLRTHLAGLEVIASVERERDQARDEIERIENESGWIVDAKLPLTAYGEKYVRADLVLLIINKSKTEPALFEFTFGVSVDNNGTKKSVQFFEDHGHDLYQTGDTISSLAHVPPKGHIFGHLLFVATAGPSGEPPMRQGDPFIATLVITDRISGKEIKVIPTGQKVVLRSF